MTVPENNMEIQFDRNDLLGIGGYGSVFVGVFKDRRVAVKRVELVRATENEEALKQLDHPNIVKLFHVECTKDFKHFAFELCDASLDQIFLEPENPRKYKGPKLPYHFEIFSQLASGLKYIHSNNLIHRDIKPGNVLISVDSTGQEVKVTMKWADFGLSRSVNKQGTYTMNSGVKGTRMWYAPELLRLFLNPQQPNTMEQPRGTVKSDVFSTGLVFACLILDGQHLYGSTEIDINNKIMKGNIINIKKFDRSHYAYDLVPKMLQNKPEDRISTSDIVEQLKSIKFKLEEKEKEMFELCATNDPVVSYFPFQWTNQTEKLKILIRQGIDVNVKNKDGQNALHLLCANSSNERLIDAIKLLIQLGIDVNGKHNHGNNALHFLCSNNNSSEKLIDATKLLIQLGIDVNKKNHNGSNALHYLCRYNSSERLIDAIKLLIQLGTDVNGKVNNGINALHLLCRYNSSEKLIDAIKILIQLGIEVNKKNHNGRNALYFLCANNSSDRLIEAIKLLTQMRIDVTSNGLDARLILRENYVKENLVEIIKLLDAASLS